MREVGSGADLLERGARLVDLGAHLGRIGTEHSGHVDRDEPAVDDDAELAELPRGPEVAGERLPMPALEAVDPGLHRATVCVDVPALNRQVSESGGDAGQRFKVPLPD